MAPQRTPHRLPTHDDRGRLIIPSDQPRNRQATSLFARARPQQNPHSNPPIDSSQHYQRLPYPIVDQKHPNSPVPPHSQVAHPQNPDASQSRDSYHRQPQGLSRTTSAPNVTSASSQLSALDASHFTKYYPNVIRRMNSNNQVGLINQSSLPSVPFSSGSRQSSATPEPNVSFQPPSLRSTPSPRVGMGPPQANRQVPVQQELNHSIPIQAQSTNSQANRPSSAQPKSPVQTKDQGPTSSPGANMNPVQAHGQVPTQQNFNFSVPMPAQSRVSSANQGGAASSHSARQSPSPAPSPSGSQFADYTNNHFTFFLNQPHLQRPVAEVSQPPSAKPYNKPVSRLPRRPSSLSNVLASSGADVSSTRTSTQHDQAGKPPSASPKVALRNDGGPPQGDQHSSTRSSTPECRQPPNATPASRPSDQTTASEPPQQLCTRYYHTQPVENPINIVWKDAPLYKPELVIPSSTNVDTIDPRLLFMKNEADQELMDKEAQEAKSGVARELTVDAVLKLLLGALDGSAT